MINNYFVSLEERMQGHQQPLHKVLDNLAYNERGLIPVIVQNHLDQKVLMMAWMNRAAIEKTLDSGYMTYWSRSRSSFWLKGETSGNRQRLVGMRVDCDGDTLLCDVEPLGPACHTNRETCFYLQVDNIGKNVMVECSPPSSS